MNFRRVRLFLLRYFENLGFYTILTLAIIPHPTVTEGFAIWFFPIENGCFNGEVQDLLGSNFNGLIIQALF